MKASECATWFAPSTREEFETELDAGNVFVEMSNGNFWQLRRNGRTQTWKTRPGEFRTPTKAGLKAYGEFTQRDLGNRAYRIKGSTL